MNALSTFTPNNLLLEKLTLRPEISSNHLNIAFIDQRFSTQASPIKRVSSAYWRCETTTSELTLNP
ncbi:hypothetical protein A2U01_0094438, partial [Trifolium medium]|nr:hypothetical protein [Trifolium medium]